jgi:hypothetical protein
MADPRRFDPDLEWLDLAQPVGLVVARCLLKELGLPPQLQTRADSAAVGELLSREDENGPALPDAWAFAERILRWPAVRVAGVPGGPPLPEDLVRVLPEHDTVLEPHWAVSGIDGGWQLLVRIEAPGIKPDARGALAGWEATPHQRFERLLRETGIPIGILISHNELRLVYAPRGETSGWLPFPLRPMSTVAGRPLLGGLKLMLDGFRLFNDAENRRLPALLKASREAQTTVSTTLADQVVGALHDLLRGLTAAAPKLVGALAIERPQHLYEGLLTVLMRLVFVLYAEDRDLIPSRTDEKARTLYSQSYSVRGLHGKLLEDLACHPDTIDERRGAWGGLVALFRLIHAGDRTGWIRARGGKLFDPDAFPFLEGRTTAEEPPCVLPVTDGCVLRVLDGLLTLTGERLSYRTLDVEQIGSVYETVMGFTVLPASGSALAIRAGKHNRTPVFVDLAEFTALKPEQRLQHLKEGAQRGTLTDRQQRAIKAAAGLEEMIEALDSIVDERGSPEKRVVQAGTPILQPTDERRRTGSHYTPRSLTEPIVRHPLEPAFERLGPNARPEDVLDLKICDLAMGSGAFLVEACRALAARLAQAWARWPETRPKLPADEDEDLRARRLVAQRCLYGVDKNPMATDLAKLSLWLATLARDHEFTFLDHALKSGDSLVGLTRTQIGAVHWDTGKPGLPLFQNLIRDRFDAALAARAEIRDAPDDVERAIQEARYQQIERRLSDARLLGDAVIAAFFSADKPRAREAKRQEIESWLNEPAAAMWMKISGLASIVRLADQQLSPFHWEIEFPEVFERANPGFDAMVGNPPFLGGRRLSTGFGDVYAEAIRTLVLGQKGAVNLVGYFLTLLARLTRREGHFGLVATSALVEGETRTNTLRPMLLGQCSIIWARSKTPWPGEAGVHIVQLAMKNGRATGPFLLDGRAVVCINSRLEGRSEPQAPVPLNKNRSLHSDVVKVQGIGFVLSDEEAKELVRRDSRYLSVISRYVTGEDLNSLPHVNGSRWVINFDGMSEREARAFAEPFRIVEDRVKPYREGLTRQVHETCFWKFWDRREEFFSRCSRLRRVIVMSKLSKYRAVSFGPITNIYSEKVKVFASDDAELFGALQSQVHDLWSLREGASTGETPAYSGTKCFDTFALPLESTFCAIRRPSEECHQQREAYRIAHALGLTDFYNRFNNPDARDPDLLTVRELHAAMDRAVLNAYGWCDMASDCEFVPDYEDDDEERGSKQKPWRYRWAEEVRDEVLARLLALNAERAAGEREAGHHLLGGR